MKKAFRSFRHDFDAQIQFSISIHYGQNKSEWMKSEAGKCRHMMGLHFEESSARAWSE
jgi:hypothetical protein